MNDGRVGTPGPALEGICDRIRTERRILGDERTAFRAFLDRIDDVEPPVSTATIRDHYRSTVMSVPHYHTEYGDALPVSVAAEFGGLIAEDLQSRTALDAHDVAAIVGAGERAIDERDTVIDRVDAERHSVETAAIELAAIRSELGSLPAPWDREPNGVAGTDGSQRIRLTALRERCRAVASDRRRHLRGAPPCNDPEFRVQALLYHDSPVDRPVLAAVTRTHRAIDDHRQALLDGASAER